MLSQVLTPKIILLAIGILVLVAWVLFFSDQRNINAPNKNMSDGALSTLPVFNSEARKKEYPMGIYVSTDKKLVSVNVNHMPRLLVIQRMAEMAGFHFGLPDEDIDYWGEPLTITMQNRPINEALSLVIGTKKFTQEMLYDSSGADHKISAIFLASDAASVDLAASPLNKKHLLHSESEYNAAPNINFAVNDEQQIKRDNFYNVDDESRIVILQEMSPVGEDLHYIIASLRQDKNAQVRAVAAQRLSFSESYVATQSLIEALSDNEPMVVEMAVESLVSLGDVSVLSAMKEKLGASENNKKFFHDAALRIQSRFAIPADSMH